MWCLALRRYPNLVTEQGQAPGPAQNTCSARLLEVRPFESQVCKWFIGACCFLVSGAHKYPSIHWAIALEAGAGGRGLVEDAHPVASGGGCEDLGKQGLLPTLHVHNTTLKDNTPSYTRLLHIATRNMQCLAQDAQNQISKENATGTPKLLRMGT